MRGKMVHLGADAGHRVFDKNYLITSIEGSARGGLDTKVRGDSTQDDGANSSPPQLLVKFRAVKCAPLPLGDHQVAALIAVLGNKL